MICCSKLNVQKQSDEIIMYSMHVLHVNRLLLNSLKLSMHCINVSSMKESSNLRELHSGTFKVKINLCEFSLQVCGKIT